LSRHAAGAGCKRCWGQPAGGDARLYSPQCPALSCSTWPEHQHADTISPGWQYCPLPPPDRRWSSGSSRRSRSASCWAATARWRPVLPNRTRTPLRVRTGVNTWGDAGFRRLAIRTAVAARQNPRRVPHHRRRQPAAAALQPFRCLPLPQASRCACQRTWTSPVSPQSPAAVSWPAGWEGTSLATRR
jgi:hypothetical protein